MKAQWTILFNDQASNGHGDTPKTTTRERVARSLRAARSRTNGHGMHHPNHCVMRTGLGYYIRDCGLNLFRAHITNE